MAGGKTAKNNKKPIEQYDHKDKQRANNPPVGLVTPQTDPPEPPKKTYAYDPHLDPQLVWAGKAERMSFEVPTVSLHVHERIDPRTIIEAVRKRNGAVAAMSSSPPGGPDEIGGQRARHAAPPQMPLFETREENPPLREAIDFYKHPHGWSNRLIAGDSLLVMNSLLEKEGMAGQVQMVYIDPPYGIKYGSNFQPFVNKRDVKDGKDEDLTQEPEMIRAFRDTWELGIHSYLSYLRDRLWLAKELMHESGSCFVQISVENLHLIRNLMDEVFGAENCSSVIAFNKSSGLGGKLLPSVADFLVWYAKDQAKIRYRQLFKPKVVGEDVGERYNFVLEADGTKRRLTTEEQTNPSLLRGGSRVFTLSDPTAQGFRPNTTIPYEFEGRTYHPGENRCWRTTREGLDRLAKAGRLLAVGNSLAYIRFIDDFPSFLLNSVWADIGGIMSRSDPKIYAVQTSTTAVARCVLMTTDPGDLVLDPTCGSGTTPYVAEQWGRRWITCDTSRVAITLAKQRLMTALYDYYELAHPEEGVGSGFKYKTVPHITLKSIANNEPPGQETLYDQPFIDKSRARVSGSPVGGLTSERTDRPRHGP